MVRVRREPANLQLRGRTGRLSRRQVQLRPGRLRLYQSSRVRRHNRRRPLDPLKAAAATLLCLALFWLAFRLTRRLVDLAIAGATPRSAGGSPRKRPLRPRRAPFRRPRPSGPPRRASPRTGTSHPPRRSAPTTPPPRRSGACRAPPRSKDGRAARPVRAPAVPARPARP